MYLSTRYVPETPSTSPAERRRHRRVAVRLPGRYMLQNRQEFECESVDLSAGGVALRAPVLGSVGDRVVVYLDLIGRLEGRVVRHTHDGFALALSASDARRERLIDHLTWLANRDEMGVAVGRRHDRIVPLACNTVLRFEDGTEAPGRIMDVSMSGAAIAIDPPPPIGAPIVVGRTPGRVIRHVARGIGVEFLRLVPMDLFDEKIVL